MKIYALQTIADAAGDIVSFGGDRSNRLSAYFMWGEGDGKFLDFSTPRARAQSRLTSDLIAMADYLDADISIPIFSPKAAQVLGKEIPDEVELHPLTIHASGVELAFFLCKVCMYTSLVDEAHSSFRALSDGTPFLGKAVYYKEFARPFHIARDLKHKSRYIVSQAFVELCDSHGLKLRYVPLEQSDAAAPGSSAR